MRRIHGTPGLLRSPARGRGGGNQGHGVAMRTRTSLQTKPHTGWAVATHTMIQMHGRALAIARTGGGRVSGGGQAVAMVASIHRDSMMAPLICAI